VNVLPRYNTDKSYDWNFANAPDDAVIRSLDLAVPAVHGEWMFCGLPVNSPLGVPAGPLLNGQWCLYYARLGWDVLTYKTVRSRQRACYPLPNLAPVECAPLNKPGSVLPAVRQMSGSWAVSFGMPSQPPEFWRADIERTRNRLQNGQLLTVSVTGTAEAGDTLEAMARDYATCARWAIDAGADVIEANFSCPNVATPDGQLYQQPADAAFVAQMLHETTGDTPLILKTGFIETREQAAALIEAVAPYAAALCMTNSIAARVQDGSGPLFGNASRGICGDAIRQASTRQIATCAAEIERMQLQDQLQLIATGGVSNATHVRGYLAAGASAVHMATAAMVNPLTAIEIRQSMLS